MAEQDPTTKPETDLALYVEIGERIESTAEITAEEPEPDARKCRAHTSGLHGAKRPCRNWAIKGGTVCPYHGGKAPQVKAAAQRRLQAMLDPALTELNDLLHQNAHLPSKLGAISNVMNRTLGKVGESKDKGQKGATINIGFNLGGLPAGMRVDVPTPKEDEDDTEIEEAIDGEFIEEDE